MLASIFGGNETGFIGSPEAAGRFDPDVDQQAYIEFLEAARQVARVGFLDDDFSEAIIIKTASETES